MGKKIGLYSEMLGVASTSSSSVAYNTASLTTTITFLLDGFTFWKKSFVFVFINV